jgi:hypothetical protein
MGPRSFWIALAIVLFYLIARPHVGTVYVRSVVTTLNGVASSTHGTALKVYPSSAECEKDAHIENQGELQLGSGKSEGLFWSCSASTRLLWGW